jgi:putative tryptophan/tyrosine transport system substrate-binding protein
MNRRTFLCGLTLGTLAAPLAAEGQLGQVPRIGVLTLSVAFSTPTFQAFLQGLRDQGYVEGQNIALELRFANGSPGKLGAMATDLVRKKVDVIVTESVLAAREARNAHGNHSYRDGHPRRPGGRRSGGKHHPAR